MADKAERRLTAFRSFPDYGLRYRLEVTAEGGGMRVAIHLDKPLPEALVGQAGFTFIPGGLAPGFVIVKPDLAEFQEDWPFLWFESEYVVSTATAFIPRQTRLLWQGHFHGATRPPRLACWRKARAALQRATGSILGAMGASLQQALRGSP